ncbi:MAG: LUD domain-containing protein [Planctomycetes bacterium]|nr:LUD domain-containing protein [Planctomycetota bacterium]
MNSASESRNAILSAVRSRQVPPAELPALTGTWITFADRAKHFAETLQSVGGQCVPVADDNELRAELQKLTPVSGAHKIHSAFPDVLPSSFDLNQVSDPHTLEDLDFALLPAEFAVAENGAVWLNTAHIKHRAILFITQHLAFVVPRQELVNNMHEAYARLQFQGPGYGLFLSGPSKTADIEQSLVIGAHGARSLTVFLRG